MVAAAADAWMWCAGAAWGWMQPACQWPSTHVLLHPLVAHTTAPLTHTHTWPQPLSAACCPAPLQAAMSAVIDHMGPLAYKKLAQLMRNIAVAQSKGDTAKISQVGCCCCCCSL